MIFPGIVVIHRHNHFLEVLDALLEVAELLNAQLFDDALLQCMFLDSRFGLVFSSCDSYQGLT